MQTVVQDEKIDDNFTKQKIVIGNSEEFKKDQLEISYLQLKDEYINEIEKKNAEDFLNQVESEVKHWKYYFTNFNIQQSSEIIKNDSGILGILITQKINDDVKHFSRYYYVGKKKQLQAKDIFYPHGKWKQLQMYVSEKYPDNKDVIEKSETDENQMAFVFDKNGNLTLYYDGMSPVELDRKEISRFVNRRFRDVLRLPLPYDCDKEPCVALTFDDGPNKQTERLLEILSQNDAEATFFVLGINAKENSEILKRVHLEGHQIGNHSWNHKNFTTLTLPQLAEQLDKTNQVVENITGIKPKVLRPPYGKINDLVLKNVKMPVILWNVDSYDWKFRESSAIIAEIVKSKKNSVILAHDIHATTVDAMESCIKQLKDKGFHLVTIEDLFHNKDLKEGVKYFNRN